MWAVWHSGVMQKMAKYQINNLKIFGGFFVPYISKRLKLKLKKEGRAGRKNKKIKVNIALLGGRYMLPNSCSRRSSEKVWVYDYFGTADSGCISINNSWGYLRIGIFVFILRKKEILPCNALYFCRNFCSFGALPPPSMT